jgi:trimeric autotransporter adhesin
MKRIIKRLLQIAILLTGLIGAALAQTTAFTYQGKLTDNGGIANGNYDFQYKLFDTPALGTGNQQGATGLATNITVTNGIFTTTIDFGVCPGCFNGTPRFLEIAVKLTSDITFTTLGPRQPITSTPYAIRSLNAVAADGLSVACINCVTSSQIQSVNGGAVNGTIPIASVPAGSANYIQNGVNQQASSNFNISGDGMAGGTLSSTIVNATTQYNLGANRVLSASGTANLFAGVNVGANNNGVNNAFFGASSGQANTTGQDNAFFGAFAGQANTTAHSNSFFGFGAGNLTTIGGNNAFFGAVAGASNTASNNAFFGAFAGVSTTTGGNNSFFGTFAGNGNTTGSTNSFFGNAAGQNNSTGFQNSFFGDAAGISNTTGINNSFFGALVANNHTTGANNTFMGAGAGLASTTGNKNTFIGSNAGNIGAQVSNATVIGANAAVSQNNAVILGSINGINGATADTDVGIGTTAPEARLHVSGGAILIDNNQGLYLKDTTGSQKRVLLADTGNRLRIGSGGPLGLDQIRFDLSTPGTVMTMFSSGHVSIGTTTDDQSLTVNGNASKSAGGTTWAVFSDERLKTIKGRFTPGLSALLQLQPIRFEYKADNALGLRGAGENVGFSAQAVETVLPEAVSRTRSGYLQLNSDPILWTMLNAIKEQQQEIEQLRLQVQRLDALKKLVCQTTLQAAACREQ